MIKYVNKFKIINIIMLQVIIIYWNKKFTESKVIKKLKYRYLIKNNLLNLAYIHHKSNYNI